MSAPPVRWAVLGTANIARGSFLPAMRAAGGVATVVGSRDPDRAAAWASDNQVGRAASYDDALAADDVDAVYVAVPNDAHVEWAAKAAATGRPVLCEKPLGLSTAQVDELLAAVGDRPLWEAFVFPFHPQTELLRTLCAPGGPVGPAREIVSEFQFRVTRPGNIRWDAARGGGALMDVGCYPIRLARLLFDAEPHAAVARAVLAPSGVDAEVAAVLAFPGDESTGQEGTGDERTGDRRLILSVGMRRAYSTFTRVIGDDAELRIVNPFHPSDGDTVELWREGEVVETWTAGPVRAFQHGVQHVQDVVRGAAPVHLAAAGSRGNAVAIDLVRAAFGPGVDPRG